MPKNPKPTPKKSRKKVIRKAAVKAVKTASPKADAEKLTSIPAKVAQDSPKSAAALPQAPLLVRLSAVPATDKPVETVATGTLQVPEPIDARPTEVQPTGEQSAEATTQASKISGSVPPDVHLQAGAAPAPSKPTPEEAPKRQEESAVMNAKSVKSAKPVHGRLRPIRLVLGLLLVAALVLGGLQFMKSRQASADDRLIGMISKRVVLPTSEKPQVSTVVDETKVNQPFLANSRKGDKVLLYFQESRAVVYRPSTGQVVNMGPLVSPNPRVQLRNGTNDDIPLQFRNKLTGSTEYAIASQDVAVKRDYSQTIVIDVAGNRPDVARRLAVLLGAKIAELPDSETRPDADMLVIVGSDAN